MGNGNEVGGRDKNSVEITSSVPRSLDYQIAGIIAGGVAGELIYLGFKAINYQTIFNEPSFIIIGAILGFLFWGRFARALPKTG